MGTTYKKRKKLSTTLVLILLLIGIIPMLIVGIVSMTSASRSIDLASEALKVQIFNQLQAINELKKKQLHDYFENDIKKDITLLATRKQAIDGFHLLKEYHDATGASGETGINVKATDYETIWEKIAPFFKTYKDMGFYDVYIICKAHGHVLFSVDKNSDLGENLVIGSLKDSPLAEAWKGGLKDFTFVDFASYAPAGGKPVCFISTPIKEDGVPIAVIVLQITQDRIDEIMQERTGMGQTGETYVVGPNHYMRSDSYNDKENFSVAASFKKNNKVDTVSVKEALEGKTSAKEIKNYKDIDVLSAYTPFKIGKYTWAFLSEITAKEGFAPIRDLQTSFFNVLIMLIILGVILILVTIIVAFVLARSLAKPLVRGVDFANFIANKDLTADLNVNRDDEIGQLADALVMMRDQLIEIITNVNEIATNVAASSEEINATAQSLSEGAQTQASSVEQTSASLEELTSSINQVNNNSREVASKMTNLELISSDSQLLIEQTIDGMKKIQNSSNKIEEIISVINDIADQTNLLSLNASIEAARAGEHGRGFAVVAEEISKLADRSAVSTKEVANLVKESIANVVGGVEMVNKSGSAFEKIYEDVKKNAEIIQNIVNAIDQQAQGADQVQNAMNQINDVTQTVSASAEEMAGSTVELQNQSENLKSLIDEFKITKASKSNKDKNKPENIKGVTNYKKVDKK